MNHETIVLLSPDGEAIGTAPKKVSHHQNTPPHLAFSCYITDPNGQVLVTQRAHEKATFPSVWTALPFPQRTSPHYPQAQTLTLNWARTHHLITPATEPAYTAADYAGLGTRWVPDAPLDGVLLATDASAFAALFDDQFDSLLGTDPHQATAACRDVHAILDGAALTTTPYASAFADLWTRQIRGRSPTWIHRAAIHWKWFFNAFTHEAENRATEKQLTFDGYLFLRRKSGWVNVMIDLIEASHDFETTPDDRTHGADLITTVCDIIDLFNDLHSIKKEEAIGDPHNAVFILQKQHGLTRDEATRQAAGYVHRWTHQFHAQKIALTPGRPNLQRLYNLLPEAIGGYMYWQATSLRYQ